MQCLAEADALGLKIRRWQEREFAGYFFRYEPRKQQQFRGEKTMIYIKEIDVPGLGAEQLRAELAGVFGSFGAVDSV
jgi:hypothetical protein